jgi:hypothetical protein
MVWRVKLVAELEPGLTTEVEIARLERDEQAGLADLGLRLAEAKQLTAALQAQMVPAQVIRVGELGRSCVVCGGALAGKGHYGATFRSVFGDVPVRVRRLLGCPCQRSAGAKSFAALDLEAATVAPELAYVTARYAALAPFGKIATAVGIASDRRGVECRHGAEQDVAGRRGRGAAASPPQGRTDHDEAKRTCRGWT